MVRYKIRGGNKVGSGITKELVAAETAGHRFVASLPSTRRSAPAGQCITAVEAALGRRLSNT